MRDTDPTATTQRPSRIEQIRVLAAIHGDIDVEAEADELPDDGSPDRRLSA